MNQPFTLHQGDNLPVLRCLPDNSVDSVVTDPPYGLSREPDMAEVLRHWLAGDDYEHGGAGFMGKSWDSFVPGPAVWREVLRVLKPGGHVFAFSGTRTYDMAVLAMRLAGFEIRDQFAWTYGSGMPKSRNLGDGWGTQAKPAWEPIVLARKPFKGTAEACRREHGTGGLNIDACRIQTGESIPVMASSGGRKFEQSHTQPHRKNRQVGTQDAGRWPANLLHDGSDEVLACFPTDAGGKAPVTGDEPSAASVGMVTNARARVASDFIGDSGSAARFFYCGKASTAEREAGLYRMPVRTMARSHGAQAAEEAGEADANGKGGFNRVQQRRNIHPTVKPIAVGRWLQRMITPPGGVTLDLYGGSGSFGVSAILEGFHPILIELDRDDEGNPLGYEDIIRARCTWAVAERERERLAAARAQREAANRAAQTSMFEDAAP